MLDNIPTMELIASPDRRSEGVGHLSTPAWLPPTSLPLSATVPGTAFLCQTHAAQQPTCHPVNQCDLPCENV